MMGIICQTPPFICRLKHQLSRCKVVVSLRGLGSIFISICVMRLDLHHSNREFISLGMPNSCGEI